jgi:hypothetical protein
VVGRSGVASGLFLRRQVLVGWTPVGSSATDSTPMAAATPVACGGSGSLDTDGHGALGDRCVDLPPHSPALDRIDYLRHGGGSGSHPHHGRDVRSRRLSVATTAAFGRYGFAGARARPLRLDQSDRAELRPARRATRLWTCSRCRVSGVFDPSPGGNVDRNPFQVRISSLGAPAAPWPIVGVTCSERLPTFHGSDSARCSVSSGLCVPRDETRD